jgi:pyruvate dehydrogenase E2 component (dihydrolipoamide acetyltransferase)
MNIEFKLPELGENIESGDVVSVLVREGDVIAGNDGVIEVETDKAVVEIPCPHAGRVAKVLLSKGQTVKVGQPVLLVEVEEAVETQPSAAPAQPSAAKPQVTAVMAEPPLAASPASPEARRLARELDVDLAQVRGTGKGGRVTVEDVRAAAVAKAGTAGPGESTSAADSPLPEGEGTESPSPLPNGEGIEAAEGPSSEEEGTKAAGIPAQRGTREPAVPPGELGQDAYGPVRRERMSKIRQTIAAKMVKSVSTIPHVTNFDDADVTELERMRKTIPPAYLGPTVKLTALPFVLKAVALGLRQHPVLNSTLDEAKQEIVHKQYVNLGVAVDTPRGLVVPVIRNVDQMGVLQIARELTLLAARARSAEFGIDELRGGTFTISNLGAVGGVYSTPIINHPEVAILLLGRSRWLLGVHEGKIEGRLMMPLSLSYDHRVVDGAAAGRFLNDVIDYLQSPGKLLLTR